MLTKLLRKDFQTTARTFLPVILRFVVVSIPTKILLEVGIMSALYSDSYVSDTSEFMVVSFVVFLVFYFIYIVAFFITIFVFIVSDFYKTMVSEQAYLTHTLPVEANILITSKLTIAIFWQLVIYLLVFLSLLLFLVGHMPQVPWPKTLTGFNATLDMIIGEYAFFMITCIITDTSSSSLMFYASITIGHLFGKHKVMGAILSYPGIYTVIQIICIVVIIAFGYPFASTLIRTNTVDANFYSSFLSSYMWFTIIFSIVTSMIFCLITNFVVNRKLNLE